MLSLVIDTNVFVSACMADGASAELVRGCLDGRIEPLMSAALLAEYEDLLGRSALFDPCRLDAREREELLDIFLARCRWVRIYFGWRPNLPDEADNHLIELAVAAGAEGIATHNLKDLQRGQLRFPNLHIQPPAHWLKELTP